MRVPRLYLDQSLAPNQFIELADDRHHYLSRVLRLGVNHPLIVFNGEGGEYTATITAINKKNSTVLIENFVDVDRESPLHTELAIGLSKGERMDWVMQKATEVGVSHIVPLYTERTEVNLDEKRLHNKLQHWRQIIISACEQSQRTILPSVSEPRKLMDYLSTCDMEKKLLFHADGNRLTKNDNARPISVAMLIGPEGGFSENEVITAGKYDFICCALGPRVLRAETAPIAGLGLIQQFWGDW